MTERGGDQALAALGIRRIPVPIPFPQAGGPVNVVAIEEEGGGFALLDSGLGTPDAESALRAGLAGHGLRPQELRRILLTHGHIDHYGLAQTFWEESGAELRVHPGDREKVTGDARWVERRHLYDAFFLSAGVPREKIDRMVELAGSTRRFARPVVAPLGDLAEGDRVSFARCEGTVLHMPGHTPGLCCLLVRPRPGVEGPTVLVASDHLLEKTSPNPLLELLPDGTRFDALPSYFQSARRARALELDWVLPGHSACFPDHRAVIDSLFAFYRRRQEKLLARLPEAGASPVDLVYSIFPHARTLDLYLMIGEVLGNMDLLLAEGQVACSVEDGRIRYRPVRG